MTVRKIALHTEFILATEFFLIFCLVKLVDFDVKLVILHMKKPAH